MTSLDILVKTTKHVCISLIINFYQAEVYLYIRYILLEWVWNLWNTFGTHAMNVMLILRWIAANSFSIPKSIFAHDKCFSYLVRCRSFPHYPLRWRHNDHAGVSKHQPHCCLLNRFFRRRWKKTSKLRVTGFCAGNSPGPMNSLHKGPVTRKMFPFDDVIMLHCDLVIQ